MASHAPRNGISRSSHSVKPKGAAHRTLHFESLEPRQLLTTNALNPGADTFTLSGANAWLRINFPISE